MDDPSFPYFKGPVEQMSRLEHGGRTCTFCGRTRRCFALGKLRGCLDCLREGRFTFSHDTEIGYLSDDGLTRMYDDHKEVPAQFDRAALAGLLRTPQFVTWQGDRWLIHCDDFMVYIGEWKPDDFRRHAADGDGRKLFVEMTDATGANLWDGATPAAAVGPEDWYATYYAFRCRHCGAFRGYWDCP